MPGIAPQDAPLTAAQVLFLWAEHVRRGEVEVRVDDDGVFHFKAEGHPGCALSKTEAA